MEFVRIALCLSALVPGILSGGALLQYEDANDQPVQVMPGAKSYTLVWESDNSGSDEYTLFEIKHINPVTNEERLIGKLDGDTPSEVASGYSLNTSKPDTYKKITLTINTVGTMDDGTFVATIISNTDATQKTSIPKNVTVVKPLTLLHLQFQEQEPITSNPEDAMEVDAGTYPVKCIAEGSNPATTNVNLHLDGEAVALEGETAPEAMSGDMRQFKTTVMGNVKLEEKEAVVQLECVATDASGQTLSTKLDLKVMVPERVSVTCHETKAKEGDEAVTLECEVDHTDQNVTKMAFQLGESGEIIESGKGGASNDSVTIIQTTPGKSKIILTLAKVKDSHFDTDFYLLITFGDGKVRKETLTLESSDPGSGNCPTASFGWILFLAIAVLLNRH